MGSMVTCISILRCLAYIFRWPLLSGLHSLSTLILSFLINRWILNIFCILGLILRFYVRFECNARCTQTYIYNEDGTRLYRIYYTNFSFHDSETAFPYGAVSNINYYIRYLNFHGLSYCGDDKKHFSPNRTLPNVDLTTIANTMSGINVLTEV